MLHYANPIPPAARDLFPAAVLDASDAYAEALAAEGEADHQLAIAKQTAAAAADVDTAAARDALAAGKKPPKRTEPAAEEAVRETARTLAARQQLARSAEQAFTDLLAEHRDDVLAAVDQVDAELAERWDHLRGELASFIMDRRQATSVRREATATRVGARRVPFDVWGRPSRGEPLGRETRELLDQLATVG